MVSLKNKSKAFTIVELLIVIVVIGILATLVIVTFTGIQQKARDSKRKTDIGAIQTTLENYYGSYNTFPTLTDFNSATWRAANLKGFDGNTLQDPKGTTQTLIAGTTPSAVQYSYQVTDAAGTLAAPTACSDAAGAANPCVNYGIYAKLESDGSTFSKVSNN